MNNDKESISEGNLSLMYGIGYKFNQRLSIIGRYEPLYYSNADGSDTLNNFSIGASYNLM